MDYKINKELSELIGVLIGDGNIYYNPKIRKYYFEITGDPELEKDYFEYVSNLVYSLIGKKPSIRKSGRGLRLRLYSKEFIEFLINVLDFPYGKNKGKTVKIPEKITSRKWEITKYCLRGITDTDGSLFVSRKGNVLNYPCIEISTISKPLAIQISEMISPKYRVGFREFQMPTGNTMHKLSLNGNKIVSRWIKDVGFSNKRKLNKWNGTGVI